jgi:hypothetical protein
LRDDAVTPPARAALSSFQLDALTADMRSGAGTTTQTARAAATGTALSAEPSGTRITCRVAGGALVFRLPPSARGVGITVFLAGWLVAWIAGIVAGTTAFVSTLPKDDESLGPTVIIGGWLIAAIVAAVVVISVLATRLSNTLAERYLICTADTLFLVTRLWFFKRVAAYELRYVRNAVAKERIRRPMQIPDDGMEFGYGKRTVAITGITQAEAAWIVAAIEQHRSSP